MLKVSYKFVCEKINFFPGRLFDTPSIRDVPTNRVPFSAENSGTGLCPLCLHCTTGMSIEAIFSGQVKFDMKESNNFRNEVLLSRTGIMFSNIHARTGS